MDEVEKLEIQDTSTPQQYLDKINNFLKQINSRKLHYI